MRRQELPQQLPVSQRESIASQESRRGIQDLTEVASHVAGHREREPRLTGRDRPPIGRDTDADECADIKNEDERGQPGLTIVLGAKECQNRIGKVRFQEIRGPLLPVPQLEYERTRVMTGAAEQARRRWRRTRPGIEERNS